MGTMPVLHAVWPHGEEGARITVFLFPASFSSLVHRYTSVAPFPPPIPRWASGLCILPSTFSYSLLGEEFILPMPCGWYVETLPGRPLMRPTMAMTSTHANLWHSLIKSTLASNITISADGKKISILLPLIPLSSLLSDEAFPFMAWRATLLVQIFVISHLYHYNCFLIHLSPISHPSTWTDTWSSFLNVLLPTSSI